MVGTAVATTLESIAATRMATSSPAVTRTWGPVQLTPPIWRVLVVMRGYQDEAGRGRRSAVRPTHDGPPAPDRGHGDPGHRVVGVTGQDLVHPAPVRAEDE